MWVWRSLQKRTLNPVNPSIAIFNKKRETVLIRSISIIGQIRFWSDYKSKLIQKLKPTRKIQSDACSGGKLTELLEDATERCWRNNTALLNKQTNDLPLFTILHSRTITFALIVNEFMKLVKWMKSRTSILNLLVLNEQISGTSDCFGRSYLCQSKHLHHQHIEHEHRTRRVSVNSIATSSNEMRVCDSCLALNTKFF